MNDSWRNHSQSLAYPWQVHNALGFCLFQQAKLAEAEKEYRRAVELQPGYVTAWNNLGDALEGQRKWRDALTAYQEALTYAPNNKVAQQRSDFCRNRVTNLRL